MMNTAQGPAVEMPKYQSHKKVWALKIKQIDPVEGSEDLIIHPEDERYGLFLVDAEYAKKHKPQAGGYYVVYEDGYKSWSPADAFEAGNTLIVPIQSTGLTFGQAIEAAKEGKRVARTGWNGSGMYAVIMPGYPDGIVVNEVTQKVHGVPPGTVMKFRPYWALKTAQNDVATWAPSGSDSLAEDWLILD